VALTCNPSYSGGRDQEAGIRKISVQSQPRKIVHETYLEKTLHTHTQRLVVWLKVWALSSNPSTTHPSWVHSLLSQLLGRLRQEDCLGSEVQYIYPKKEKKERRKEKGRDRGRKEGRKEGVREERKEGGR
jgi:hypothetical protein